MNACYSWRWFSSELDRTYTWKVGKSRCDTYAERQIGLLKLIADNHVGKRKTTFSRTMRDDREDEELPVEIIRP